MNKRIGKITIINSLFLNPSLKLLVSLVEVVGIQFLNKRGDLEMICVSEMFDIYSGDEENVPEYNISFSNSSGDLQILDVRRRN